MGYVGELPAAIASCMDETDENLALEVLRLPGHWLLTKTHTCTHVLGMLKAVGDSKVGLGDRLELKS